MRHRIGGFKLGRDSEHRAALRRNLAIALFTHGQITTSIPKAKAVKPFIEKLITAARRGDLASRQRVIRELGNPIIADFDPTALDKNDLRVKKSEGYTINRFREVEAGPRIVKKLFDEIAPRYADRPGGYTRLIRLGKHRIGDGTDLCVLQLVGEETEGPQVSGRYSRRRDKANHRMDVAAKLRKAKSAKAAKSEAPPPSADAAADSPGDEDKS